MSKNGSFCVTIFKNSLSEDPVYVEKKIDVVGGKNTKLRREKNWGLLAACLAAGLAWLDWLAGRLGPGCLPAGWLAGWLA